VSHLHWHRGIADDTNGATLQVASAEDVVDYSVRRRRAEGESQATAKARSLLGGTINEPEKTYRDNAEPGAGVSEGEGGIAPAKQLWEAGRETVNKLGDLDTLKQQYYRNQIKDVKPAAEYGETQKLVLSGGPPAAGKTSKVKEAGVDISKSVIVNADDVKKLAGKENDNTFHEDSSRIANDLLEDAIDSGRNVVYDSQLTNFAKADDQIKKVIGKGGDVYVFLSMHPLRPRKHATSHGMRKDKANVFLPTRR